MTNCWWNQFKNMCFIINYLVVLIAFLMSSGLGIADTWPTYRHDSARSGITSENVDLVALKLLWIYQSKFPPQPAWLGPARRDGWHKVDNLKPKMIFDWAFHVVMDEKSVYFGSSADDQVYCLDAEDGKVRWKFFAEAPIRFAPTIYRGNVYVGADDGLVYCVSAETGREIWRYEADPDSYRLPGNGRMISVSPIRSGVLVGEDVAYFCAGIFSFNNALLCAVDAQNGYLIWQEKISGFSPQGYLLSSTEQLYVQNSRGNPFVFKKSDGRYLHTLGGGGGTFALISDNTLISGPGNTGQMNAFKVNTKTQVATFKGNQMIVTPGVSYLHTDDSLSALDRYLYLDLIKERSSLTMKRDVVNKEFLVLGEDIDTPRGRELRGRLEDLNHEILKINQAIQDCQPWKVACSHPYSLILAGNILLAGGQDSVIAVATETGKTVWNAGVNGRALEIAVSNGRVVVSTDKGTIHCFGG